eukprot:TRINITY_DN27087_c0_g1_i1.p1 TRINITY_DN27087_c0_g1~~TRINITY_DN27087_c0_g1_i1.p1  ORF type:complete len:665 (-),score=130.35 TRINITY_DN27087_c0_g1_i1:273-2267(-)
MSDQAAKEAQVEDAKAPEPSNDTDDIFFVSLQFKGTIYEVPVQVDDAVISIFDFVQEVLDLPRENCKLIFKGKVVRLDDASQTVGGVGLMKGSKIQLMGSTAHDVSYVQNSRADPLVKGFVEEERDERNRRKRARAAESGGWGTKQDAEFNFGSIKAEFKYSTPPPYEAEKLLKRLATDPGIIEIMKTRKFKVGVLTEMSPQEAADRMAKRGTPNMDLLGYNMNFGGMIVLKLRTDNVKGFRPYHDLINTLIHEMTHNVWGPHDHNFWKLFGELKAQYMRFHKFWSHGGQSSADNGGNAQFGGFSTGVDDEDGDTGTGFGQALGGADPEQPALTDAQRRERALLAAEARKVTAAPGPNFLASNGTWMFLCPCGQAHELKDCPFGGKKPGAEDDDEDEEDAPTSKQWPDDEPSPPQPTEPPAPVAETTQPQPSPAVPGSSSEPESKASQDIATPSASAEASAGTQPTGISVQEAGDADVTTPTGDVNTDTQQAPASASEPTMQTPPEVAAAVSSDAAAVSEAAAAAQAMPALDASELEALGLDGTAVWIANFSERVNVLRQRSPATARASLEMLLKLVKNVVTNPSEAKFRRIRAENAKIRSVLLEPAGDAAEALVSLLGFDSTTENGERIFLLKDAAYDAVRLRMGQELLENNLLATGAVAGGS